MATWQLVQYVVTGITVGSINAIVGLGFTIIYSVTGIINFAQGEFVMLGGMIAFSFIGLGLPMPVALILAVMLVTLAGIIFNLVAIRPAGRASTITLIIITIGGALFIRAVAGLYWGRKRASGRFNSLSVIMPLWTSSKRLSRQPTGSWNSLEVFWNSLGTTRACDRKR